MLINVVSSGRRSKIMTLECDTCHKSITRRFNKKVSEHPRHYCDQKCRSKSSYVSNSISAANVRRFMNPLARQRMALSRTGYVRTEDDLHAQSLRMREQWRDEKYRDAHSGANHYQFGKPLSRETIEKCHETMRKNGSYRKSIPEDACYAFLCQEFGESDVERQVLINCAKIDFYVKSIDTYIQFDGVYWHGLNLPLEEIRRQKSVRGERIARNFDADRKQDAWFHEHNMRLVRITDKEFESSPKSLVTKLKKKNT